MTPSDLSALTFSLLAAAPAPARSPSGQPDHTDATTLPLFANVLAQTQDSAAAAAATGVTTATAAANATSPMPMAAAQPSQPSPAPISPDPASSAGPTTSS
ncbi:MAG: hypothetical protein ACMV16_05015, partial [Macromonas sp.]